MNWIKVINTLREESGRDARRARDAVIINGDKTGAMLLTFASILGNRLALALEAGIVTDDMPQTSIDRMFQSERTKGAKKGVSPQEPDNTSTCLEEADFAEGVMKKTGHRKFSPFTGNA